MEKKSEENDCLSSLPVSLAHSRPHDLFVDREKEVEGPRLEGARRGFAHKKIYNIFLSLSVNTRHASTIDYWCLMPEGSEEERDARERAGEGYIFTGGKCMEYVKEED